MTDAIDWKIAGFRRHSEFKPVTVGSLRRRGHVLEVHCCGCGRCEELDAATLPFEDVDPVPALASRFRCSRCGSREIITRGQVYDEPTSVHQARVHAAQAAQRERKC